MVRNIKTFLINTVTAWDEPPRARHQLSFSLARDHKVIFIARNKTGLPKVNIFNPQKSIKLVEPYFPVNYKFRYRLPGINEIYQRWLFKWISDNLDFDYCVNFDFTATLIYNYFPRSIYYCNDDYIGNSRYPLWFVNKYHEFCERSVIKKAVFCIVTARFLEDKLSRFNRHTCLIPLGGPVLKNFDIPLKKATNSETITLVLMYVNTRQMSRDIVGELLNKADIRLVCIGPPDKEFEKKIKNHENVDFKGVLKGKTLYEEINKADIGIAPYDLTEANKGVTPNKLWHYFSVGKPVVVTNLPNLSFFNFPDKYVYIDKSGNEFYDLIRKAHSENNDMLIASRSQYADSNSWDKRTDEFVKIVNDFLGEKLQA